MKFLDALLHPDREDDPARAKITHAANLLQVGEFQLLQLAFADWYGRGMTEEEERYFFRSFALHDEVPPYLRHYARSIVAQADDGRLNIDAPAYHRFDNDYARRRSPDGWNRFLVVATLIFGVVGGGIVMASYTVKATGRCTETLPPCFTEAELGNNSSK